MKKETEARIERITKVVCYFIISVVFPIGIFVILNKLDPFKDEKMFV